MTHDESNTFSSPAGPETPEARDIARPQPEPTTEISDAATPAPEPDAPASVSRPEDEPEPGLTIPTDSLSDVPVTPAAPADETTTIQSPVPETLSPASAEIAIPDATTPDETTPDETGTEPESSGPAPIAGAGGTEETIRPTVAEFDATEDADVNQPSDPDTEPVSSGGPNWMLAFVSAWAGGFALSQVWQILPRPDLAPNERTFALVGFGTLGVGLFAFALEALLWNRNNQRGLRGLLLTLAVLLTLTGVVCLFLFNDPDPTKGRI